MTLDESAIDTSATPSGPGCSDCDAAEPSGWWVHLRRCAGCGHVGGCDSSRGQHATAHAESTGHRYIQSFEPGEDWFWDYATQEYLEGPVLAPPRHHPDDQPVPGPAGRVPQEWERLLN